MTTLRTKLWDHRSLCADLGLTPVPNAQLDRALIDRVDVDPAPCRLNSLYVPRLPHRDDIDPPDQVAEGREALEKGASIVLTEAPAQAFPEGAPIVRVPDRGAALSRLARVGRDRFEGRMVGITGSIGKTSTKALLHHVLSHFGPAEMTRGNYNGINGVRMMLASLSPHARFAVTEVSSAFPGSLPSKLPDVDPDIAILTTIGHSHLGNFADRHAILEDKIALLDALGGERIALVGEDVIALDRAGRNQLAARDVRLVPVGTSEGCAARLLDVTPGWDATHATIRAGGRDHRVVLPVPGRAHAVAALFVLATVAEMGLDVAFAAEVMAGYEPPGTQRGARWRVNVANRGRIVEVIDDSQNAAPESVRELADYLAMRRPARTVLVLGDMLELGAQGPDLHLGLAPDLRRAGIDELVTVGPLAGALGETLESEMAVSRHATPHEAARHLFDTLRGGELVALKASGDVGLRTVLLRLCPAAQRARASRFWRVEHQPM